MQKKIGKKRSAMSLLGDCDPLWRRSCRISFFTFTTFILFIAFISMQVLGEFQRFCPHLIPSSVGLPLYATVRAAVYIPTRPHFVVVSRESLPIFHALVDGDFADFFMLTGAEWHSQNLYVGFFRYLKWFLRKTH